MLKSRENKLYRLYENLKKVLLTLLIRYLINKIIILRIEYLIKFTILSQPLTESLMIPLKLLFKNSLSLSLSMSDSIIYNSFFSDIYNLFQHQLKAQCNNLLALFNSPTLQTIADTRFERTMDSVA